MNNIEIIFWVCLMVMIYTYIGFPLMLTVFAQLKKRKNPENTSTTALPSVSIIIPCYNEAAVLEEKIANTKALDYPTDLLEIIFIIDGSTDNSLEILNRHHGIIKLFKGERRGKSAAMNRAVGHASNSILVFTDANTFLKADTLKNLVQPFSDTKTGAVAGEKRVRKDKQGESVGSGEGLYWKYESYLKRKDAELSSATGAAGELFAIRKELWENVNPGIILDDFYISLKVVEKGYHLAYTPNAYAEEDASMDMNDEWKRKIRIAAGGFQSVFLLKGLFSFQHFTFSWQYFSHRVMRWLITPTAMLLALVLNFYLLNAGVIYQLIGIAQFSFYMLALGGYITEKYHHRIKALFLPYYFTFMHAAALVGGFNYVLGRQSSMWEKAKRRN